MDETRKQLELAAARVGVGSYQRHVFLCTGPNCCTAETGAAAWDLLKKLLKERGLLTGDQPCFRSRAGCLRICIHGPTMVVYPEGTWYHGMTAERIPRFVQEHLIEGRPIEEWIFAHNPLPSDEGGTVTE